MRGAVARQFENTGLSATDDKQPEFQRMINAATTKPPASDVILVHRFSRFFRDQFQLEFYGRRLARRHFRRKIDGFWRARFCVPKWRTRHDSNCCPLPSERGAVLEFIVRRHGR
jgi:hypothetical protein